MFSGKTKTVHVAVLLAMLAGFGVKEAAAQSQDNESTRMVDLDRLPVRAEKVGRTYPYPKNLGSKAGIYVQTITTEEGAYCVMAVAGRDTPALSCDFSKMHQKNPVPAK